MLVDEYTAQIPDKCHVAVACGLDAAGSRWWIAKTSGRLRVVVEGSEFEHEGIRYDTGDKYFVVEYYELKLKDFRKPKSPSNVVENVYVKCRSKGYVPNHLIMRHYGFDMPRVGNMIGEVVYSLPAHEKEILGNMQEGSVDTAHSK